MEKIFFFFFLLTFFLLRCYKVFESLFFALSAGVSRLSCLTCSVALLSASSGSESNYRSTVDVLIKS